MFSSRGLGPLSCLLAALRWLVILFLVWLGLQMLGQDTCLAAVAWLLAWSLLRR